jgi:hypothetical protein
MHMDSGCAGMGSTPVRIPVPVQAYHSSRADAYGPLGPCDAGATPAFCASLTSSATEATPIFCITRAR